MPDEIEEAVTEAMEEDSSGVELEYTGDPDGAGPLPHGKYKATGPKAILLIIGISFVAGVSVGIGLF